MSVNGPPGTHPQATSIVSDRRASERNALTFNPKRPSLGEEGQVGSNLFQGATPLKSNELIPKMTPYLKPEIHLF